MENQNVSLKEDPESFGPHVREEKEYGDRIVHHHYFKVDFRTQKVEDNPLFIEWKTKMQTEDDLMILQCPYCDAYFSNLAETNCRCDCCDTFYCLGCGKKGCNAFCLPWIGAMIKFYGWREFKRIKFCQRIYLFFNILIKIFTCLPLLILEKNAPSLFRCSNGEKFIKEGKKWKLKLIPYQIAFFMFYFCLNFIIFILPGIFYPPYTIYMIGFLRFLDKRVRGGTFYYEDEGEKRIL